MAEKEKTSTITNFKVLDPMEKKRNDQESRNLLAYGLASLMGAKVVYQEDYDKLKTEFNRLTHELEKAKEQNIESHKFHNKLFTTWIRMIKFLSYREKWKETTKGIERRLKELQNSDTYINPDDYQEDVKENLKEAQTCYINNQFMACYIMILRTIEIAISEIYYKHNPKKFDKFGKMQREPMISMLNWAKNRKIIQGADFTVAKGFIEARNESVHEVFKPTRLQIMSAFETVGHLLKQIEKNSN